MTPVESHAEDTVNPAGNATRERAPRATQQKPSALARLFADRARTADPPLWYEDDVDRWIHLSLAERQNRAAAAVVRGVQQTLEDWRDTQQGGWNTDDDQHRLKRVARRLRAVPQVTFYGEHRDLYFWILSFYFYGKVLEAGSREEGDRLAGLLLSPWWHSDSSFFLGQSWVRVTIASWVQTEKPDARGHVRKIDDIIYGPTNSKGKRRPRTEQLTWYREWVIWRSVTRLEAEGMHQKAALVETTDLLNNGDLGPFRPLKPLTLSSVRTAYFRQKESEQRREEEYERLTSPHLTQLRKEPLNSTK